MRTFVAVELPTELRTGIELTIRRLNAHLSSQDLAQSVQWTPTTKLHLTLRFLGETSSSQQRHVVDGLSAIAMTHRPFQLRIGRLGSFPNIRSPRVIWLGLDGDLPRLTRLQTDIEQAAQQSGFEGETRSFSPHLTIGRVRQRLPKAKQRKLGDCLKDLLVEREERDGAVACTTASKSEFEVVSLVLIRSVLKPEGAQYTVLERCLLT